MNEEQPNCFTCKSIHNATPKGWYCNHHHMFLDDALVYYQGASVPKPFNDFCADWKEDTKDFVNYVKTKNGKVKAVCTFCGSQSKACTPDNDGEPGLLGLASGWSEAPFPKNFIHDDGSSGSEYTCPPCHKKMKNGEALSLRNYGTNKPTRVSRLVL